jgi:hypothetical protein
LAGWSRWRTSAGTTAAGNFPLYQIVWPNHDGLYPWSPRATKAFREWQPVLGERPGN